MIIYIYILRDPDTKSIRYVGKSNELRINKRLKEHCQLNRLKRNNHKNNWIKKLILEGKKPELLIIARAETKNYAALEKYWIRCYFKLGVKLTNSTKGGEGLPGCKSIRVISKEQKLQISKTLKEFFKEPKNLEICSRGGKACRGVKKSRNTSGYTGVRKMDNRWIAYININKQQKHLGSFLTPELASEAYQKALNSLITSSHL